MTVQSLKTVQVCWSICSFVLGLSSSIFELFDVKQSNKTNSRIIKGSGIEETSSSVQYQGPVQILALIINLNDLIL